MSTAEQAELTVLFADIVGSTSLYEKCGDSVARDIVSQLIDGMTAAVNSHHGRVIKTIGDAVMARFDHPDHAVSAAVTIHHECDAVVGKVGRELAVKVGLHHGKLLIDHDDLFGDGVNTAARIVDHSRARKIYLTGETRAMLGASHADNCRLLDVITVKGRQQPVKLYEYVWEKQLSTQLTSAIHTSQVQIVGDFLTLRYQDKIFEMPQDRHAVSIGRGDTCDIVIASPVASRIHIKIERRGNQIHLVDNSTNGTSFKDRNGSTVVLRHDSALLSGSGTIYLNALFGADPALTLSYEVISL